MDCFCCTCGAEHYPGGDTTILRLDPACRSHGGHGLRECPRHKMPPEPCPYQDGCGMTIDKVMAR